METTGAVFLRSQESVMRLMFRHATHFGVIGVLATGASAAQPSFRILAGTPNGDGTSVAEAISADGTTVVGSAGVTEPGGWRAFRWRLDTGVVENLGIIPAGQPGRSHARAVSADGNVITGYSENTGGSIERAFRWTAQTGMVELPDLPGGSLRFQPHAISADGSVIAGWSSGDEQSAAVRWTAQSGTVSLGALPGIPFISSTAYGISADGLTIVGDTSPGSNLEAFRWTDQTGMVGLGRAGMQFSHATAANANGSVIVGYATSEIQGFRSEAFRWTEETGMVLLGSLPGGDLPFSQATAVSADGSIVVGNGRGGWIWTEDAGMVPIAEYLAAFGLSDGPYSIYRIDGISADGRVIVGTANDPFGFPVAWAAVVPAPSCVCALPLAWAGVLCRRSRGLLAGRGSQVCGRGVGSVGRLSAQSGVRDRPVGSGEARARCTRYACQREHPCRIADRAARPTTPAVGLRRAYVKQMAASAR